MQGDLIKLAKKVERSRGGAGRRGGSGPNGRGTSGSGAGASSSGAGSSGGGGGATPRTDPNQGRGSATTKQKDLVARINRVKDYYELFGVSKSAPEVDIKKAYRKLALQLHPDKNTAPGAEEAFKKVNKAWDVLSDKSKRSTYDMFGAEAAEGRPAGSGGGNPFGAGGFGGGFPGGGAGFQGVPLEEILRQFQAQGGMGGFPGGFGGFGGFPGASRSGGAGSGGEMGFDLGRILSNINPQMLLYCLPLLFIAFQAMSTLFSLVFNYWYVLLFLPLVPAQHRKQAVMLILMYCMMGGGGFFL